MKANEFEPAKPRVGMRMEEIVEGGLYVYAAAQPDWATCQQYRVVKFVVDVPSYQHKVLVEALTGKDRGLWFVTTFENFRVRYQPHEVGCHKGE